MTTSMEFKGRNLNKAVEKACSELNIPRDRLIYDVISQGSTGIFGLAVAKKAKIRVQFGGESPSDSRTDALQPAASMHQSGGDPLRSAETPTVASDLEVREFTRDPVDVGKDVLKRQGCRT